MDARALSNGASADYPAERPPATRREAREREARHVPSPRELEAWALERREWREQRGRVITRQARHAAGDEPSRAWVNSAASELPSTAAHRAPAAS